jgi:hypothetical protein
MTLDLRTEMALDHAFPLLGDFSLSCKKDKKTGVYDLVYSYVENKLTKKIISPIFFDSVADFKELAPEIEAYLKSRNNNTSIQLTDLLRKNSLINVYEEVNEFFDSMQKVLADELCQKLNTATKIEIFNMCYDEIEYRLVSTGAIYGDDSLSFNECHSLKYGDVSLSRDFDSEDLIIQTNDEDPVYLSLKQLFKFKEEDGCYTLTIQPEFTFIKYVFHFD